MAWTLSNFSPLIVRWWPAVRSSYSFFFINQQTRNVRSIGAQVVSTIFEEEEKEEREKEKLHFVQLGYFTSLGSNSIRGGITRSRRKAINGEDPHGRRRPKWFHATDETRFVCRVNHSRHPPVHCAVDPRPRQSPVIIKETMFFFCFMTLPIIV